VVVWATSGVCSVLTPALVVGFGLLCLALLLNLALWLRCEQKVLLLGELVGFLSVATVVCCVLGPLILVEQRSLTTCAVLEFLSFLNYCYYYELLLLLLLLLSII